MSIISIDGKEIGDNKPTYIIAEMSGNHNMQFERAKQIVIAAKEAGADAVKLQTYTADTITLNSDKEYFRTRQDSLWSGMTLHELYEKAYTPWEWQPELKRLANEIGITLFSSPFDNTSVDFLEEMNIPAYKIATPEISDIGLIRRVAQTGKPVIISTGKASREDIQLAIDTCKDCANEDVILLKCTSEYPAPYDMMNLATMRDMQDSFDCYVGLSDHSLGDEVAIAAVAMGAKVIEKHFILRRSDGGVDSAFSMEVDEFKQMVQKIRNVEKAMGTVQYYVKRGGIDAGPKGRSLFACANIKKGEYFSEDNVKSVRPGIGLHTRYLEQMIGKKATRDIEYAEPIRYEDISWEDN